MLFPASTRTSPSPRVVITGAGIVTALGLGWAANAEGFRSGRAAFQQVTLFDVSRQRVQSAAEVRLPLAIPRGRLGKRHAARIDRASKLLLLAATEAWEHSRWERAENLPLVLGTTSGGMSLGQDYFRQATGFPLDHRGQAGRVIHYQPQRQALDVCDALGIAGPIQIIANACASGANAVGHAWQLIRSGRATRALAGGYDALTALVFAGFDSLQALSRQGCRPFDSSRDGLALGEGAAVFALEELSQAEKRGAVILGELLGYGAATDVHHLTQPHPAGRAALTSMRAACASAGVAPNQIDYVNAHGTGTVHNDAAETAALNEWAGEAAPNLRVSSTKASVGHLLGAAGAVEVAVCLMALQGQWIPPTHSSQTIDPAVRFQVVTHPAGCPLRTALTNSFGFGGSNATLILGRRR